MGQGKRRFFTPDVKEHAVKLFSEGKTPISRIATDLGIGESLLHRWRPDPEEQTAPASNSQAAIENRNVTDLEAGEKAFGWSVAENRQRRSGGRRRA